MGNEDIRKFLGFGQTDDFNCVAISVASPDVIRSWSNGEIKNPETINYRTFKPEVGGLFCQRIFGPVRDYECACGKYKRIKYKDVVCERCGVEVTLSRVRRERMGHIELAIPISHIWFLKSLPGRLGLFMGMSGRDLERVIYFENYMVTDPGTTSLKKGQLLQEQEYMRLQGEYGEDAFIAKMGAVALRDILSEKNLEEMVSEIQEELYHTRSKQTKQRLAQRLKLVSGFLRSGSRPEWMILETLPILPPDLRPLIPLEGGRFATSDFNDLYRRVINRNNRLKSLLQLKTPNVIIHNEMRMLQEAVDALFDNGRHGRAVLGSGNRPLKSLSEMLKGKQGRFRQNLLGKRVDYSGRSVIVIGPKLRLHQCGLPKKMALVLFEPFIIRRLKELGFVHTVRSARKMIEKQSPEVWDILEEVTSGHPILLNRAPTLHRLSIQAFEPVLIEGDAIRLHPLVCAAFNADFDGDQMAVHVPLSLEAVAECKTLMLASHNLFAPSSGKSILTPSQDIVLGIYYLTCAPKLMEGQTSFPLMNSIEEVLLAEASGAVRRNDWIDMANPDYGRATRYGDATKRILRTTVGRAIFNSVLSRDLGFINKPIAKGALSELVMDIYKVVGKAESVVILDAIKGLGFTESTHAGLSISIEDMIIPQSKEAILSVARQKVANVEMQYKKGVLTEGERRSKVIDIWTNTTDEIADETFKVLAKGCSSDEVNPVYLMMDSGARGNRQQVRQLCGMRGLMAKPSGEIIERPITASFREGLSILEYFIATHGARKGLADTALKTADAGYLTRKLCDVAMDVVVTDEVELGRQGVWKQAIIDGDEEIVSLTDRIVGRCVAEDVVNPANSSEVIVMAGSLVTLDIAQHIGRCGVERVKILSPLTNIRRNRISAQAYGIDPATSSMVQRGASVGIVAAQSIGEPGTQLTLRTFHIGGVANQALKNPEHRTRHAGIVRYKDLRFVSSENDVHIVLSKMGAVVLEDGDGNELERYGVTVGTVLLVADGVEVEKGKVIAMWDPYHIPILSEYSGFIRFQDIIPGVTVKQDVDSISGRVAMIVIEHKEDLNPVLEVMKSATKGEEARVLAAYTIPIGAQIIVYNGDRIVAGALLAKTPRLASKTQDITGGLSRIVELFEARRPKEAAEMAKIDGVVSFGGPVRSKKRLWVTDNESGHREEHLISREVHMLVHEGDFVSRGQHLTEGSADPHEILQILGVAHVQEYIISEIQKVYRSQGVTIDDKHIEIIVSRMLRKVCVTDPGDTDFFWGEQVDRERFMEENEKVIVAGGKAGEAEPILQGITKASLETESFISAASFQETTRVLVDAATLGKVDRLRGFKENIIMGHLIPAGTGYTAYRHLKVKLSENLNRKYASEMAFGKNRVLASVDDEF
ncbi:MAG: DNA-directed RNA polymerase subunit beta' [Puniceicoccales bacterium]|jgi:DNA-directed RNA polymerase subunit beta'|nr:DNA-directed RNA polymerase subunit beta' [Puniceicoccales bacterium]